jgi:predicted nicotinamide N-methyase
LSVHPDLVASARDANLNTSWHMAAANNHVPMLQLLHKHTANDKHADKHTANDNDCNTHAQNASGNTPLHWAAANGHLEAVQFLLELPNADVLTTNKAGRSALTEGFTSQNESVIAALLSHSSASEERLIETPQSLQSNQALQSTITHELVINKHSVLVQEQGMTGDKLLGQARSTDDSTGLSVWPAAIVLAQCIARHIMQPTTILELGAGCGLPGLVAAKHYPQANVALTDWNDQALQQCAYNIQLNNLTNASVAKLNWQDPPDNHTRVDLLIGSDLIYQNEMAVYLHQTIKRLLQADGVFVYVTPPTSRQGRDKFDELMQQDFDRQQFPLEPYHTANPLVSQDDDLCFLHFNELNMVDYQLFQYKWRNDKMQE